MSTWAERVHRGAVSFGQVVTSCGHPNMPYPRRLDKVKFGVALDEVCKNDIPGSLLVLILKLNKEAPVKKDVFRAPGHQANMKKLIHFLQAGRLVNIDNFSVYTIASVLKKFLRKLPDGIFGREGERELFEIIQLGSVAEQRERIHRLVASSPVYTQHLLVLLFGTFRVIAANADRAQTGMTSEALGVSVAPSFFHTCVSDGKQARMEDVQRFKVATKIMKLMIDNFGVLNLFGRENYEYYARITGRILKVDDDWIFSFKYPPDGLQSRDDRDQVDVEWITRELNKYLPYYINTRRSLGLIAGFSPDPSSKITLSQQEESVSTPALIHVPEAFNDAASSGGGSLGITPENTLLTTDSYTRLSTSLEENGLYKGSSRSSRSSCSSTSHHITMEELRTANLCTESTKSLTFLPQHNSGYGLLPELQSVHERQTARMRTRSEWFLTPLSTGQSYSLDEDRAALYYPLPLIQHSNASSQELAQQRRGLARRLSRHRSSGKRNKENGSKKWKKATTAAAANASEIDVVENILANLAYTPELQRKCQKISPCQAHN